MQMITKSNELSVCELNYWDIVKKNLRFLDWLNEPNKKEAEQNYRSSHRQKNKLIIK